MKKSLASQLNNRIEIWRDVKTEGDLGDTLEPILLKKVWADMIPTGGSLKDGDGDTEYNEGNFKIKVRKGDFKTSDWIIYQGQRYDIKYILPNFNKNNYMEIHAVIRLD
jgi:head-tail adaptor